MGFKSASTLILIWTTACFNGSIDGPPPPPDAPPPEVIINLLSEFSNCMTIENWDAAQMADWSQKAVEGGTVCSSCHGAGLARFDTNVDPVAMFERNRLQTFITGFFTNNEDGTAIVVNTVKLTGKGNGSNAHPTYAVGQGDENFQNTTAFVQATNDRLAAGDCGEGGFPEPGDDPPPDDE